MTKDVATARTGADMSTPLFPEGVPKTNVDPISLNGRCGGQGR